MPRSKPSKDGITSTSGGFNVFRVVKPNTKYHQRAKFYPTRRQEVNIVRKERACLRCKLLKIKCSPGDICTTCRNMALHTHEKITMSFSGCIRTRLVEVSIFEGAIPPLEIRNSVLLKTQVLALKSITLSFASQITWNLPSLVDDVVQWLNSPQTSNTSKVGTLSSPNFLELIEPHVGFMNMLYFQRMLYSMSLAYIQPIARDKHHLSVAELQQIGAVAGHHILGFLDGKLRPESLKHCSKEDLYALFLMVFGTTLAVGYTVLDAPEGSSKTRQDQLQATQNHLCQILAHYVVYIGSQLRLPIDSQVNQFILEAAAARWHKEGNFEWLSTPVDDSADTQILYDLISQLPTDEPELLCDECLDSNQAILSDNSPLSVDAYPIATNGVDLNNCNSASQLSNTALSLIDPEYPTLAVDDGLNPFCEQGTHLVSEAVLKRFDRWDSRWFPEDKYMVSNGRFVAKGSWGVIRDSYNSVSLDQIIGIAISNCEDNMNEKAPSSVLNNSSSRCSPPNAILPAATEQKKVVNTESATDRNEFLSTGIPEGITFHRQTQPNITGHPINGDNDTAHQETSVLKSALGGFDHWDSKWDLVESADDISMLCQIYRSHPKPKRGHQRAFVPQGSWEGNSNRSIDCKTVIRESSGMKEQIGSPLNTNSALANSTRRQETSLILNNSLGGFDRWPGLSPIGGRLQPIPMSTLMNGIFVSEGSWGVIREPENSPPQSSSLRPDANQEAEESVSKAAIESFNHWDSKWRNSESEYRTPKINDRYTNVRGKRARIMSNSRCMQNGSRGVTNNFSRIDHTLFPTDFTREEKLTIEPDLNIGEVMGSGHDKESAVEMNDTVPGSATMSENANRGSLQKHTQQKRKWGEVNLLV